MSDSGKFNRGKKWYSYRNIDGVLPPSIKNDPAKICDVEYYLKNKDGEVVKPVEEVKTKTIEKEKREIKKK